MQVDVKPAAIKIMPESTAEEIMQNVRMILLTAKFTVPLDREFGLSGQIIDLPINRQARLTAELAAAINRFEPRARLKGLTLQQSDAQNGEITPVVEIEVNEQ